VKISTLQSIAMTWLLWQQLFEWTGLNNWGIMIIT
jgi:hypothetical protein